MITVKEEVVKEILVDIEAQENNGYNLGFTEAGSGFAMRSEYYTRVMKFRFGNASYSAESFSFYKDGKVVYVMNMGWFDNGILGKDYDIVKFGKHEKIKRVKKDALEDALDNQEKYGLFFVSQGKDYITNENKARIYVPLEYLENIGYRVEKRTKSSRLETNIDEQLYAGGEDNAVHMYLSSKTIRHTENYKELMLEQLQACQYKEDLQQFMDDWKFKVEHM